MEEEIHNEILQVANILAEGGVILYPTDTIWGLGCDATSDKAISRIFDIKHRSPFKSMIILVADAEMVKQYVSHPSEILLKQMTSATVPTTAIFGNAKNLPSNLVNNDGSIAIRIASDTFCQQLIKEFGKPIVSTSANISNKPSPQNFSEIDPALIDKVDYTVQYRRDDFSKNAPSVIIRLNEKNEVQRLR